MESFREFLEWEVLIDGNDIVVSYKLKHIDDVSDTSDIGWCDSDVVVDQVLSVNDVWVSNWRSSDHNKSASGFGESLMQFVMVNVIDIESWDD